MKKGRVKKKKINSWKLHYKEGLSLTPKGIYLKFMYKDKDGLIKLNKGDIYVLSHLKYIS